MTYSSSNGLIVQKISSHCSSLLITNNEKLYIPFFRLHHLRIKEQILKGEKIIIQGEDLPDFNQLVRFCQTVDKIKEINHTSSSHNGYSVHNISIEEIVGLLFLLPPSISEELFFLAFGIKNVINEWAPLLSGSVSARVFGSIVSQYLKLRSNFEEKDLIFHDKQDTYLQWVNGDFVVYHPMSSPSRH